MDEMEEFKQTFFLECAELLSDMEARILRLCEGVADGEELGAIFRCAHSIKGGARAFGFTRIADFTHALEALLDLMRDGKILPSTSVIDTLLQSADIAMRMIEMHRNEQNPPADYGAEVMTKIEAFAENRPMPAALPAPKEKTPPLSRYRIVFTPGKMLFAEGTEPMLLLGALEKLGAAEVEAVTENVPSLESLEPLECHVSWRILLETHQPVEQVKEIFAFVSENGQCLVEISTDEASPAPGGASDAVAEKAVFAPMPEKAAAAATALAPAEAPAQPSAASAPASVSSSIRVDLDKVDRLINMAGELVITESMLRAQAKRLPSEYYAMIMRGIDELSHHTRELQEAVMAIRMQPVRSIFSRMPRVVRDTAQQLGKNIQLLLSGENTEVDKTVIEQLSDPLTHMIRNSVDHGIETPDQRVWNDKPEQGTILLSAYHRSGRIVIEVQDDGAGINRDRVLAKAVEKKLVAPEAALSPEEIDHLIFLPGFSTAEQVTNVSGRGVGMDVVKRNIEALSGTVHISNRPGQGSTFTISLPLTLAILDGMIVRVGTEHYIIPITSILETMRPKATEVHSVQGRGDVMNVRGEFIPLIYLHQVFHIGDAQQRASDCLVVLVESRSCRLGLVVDELINQQQVVIKSLEANTDPVKGISGATILGDGKVSLILEINELAQLAQKKPTLVKVA